MEVRSVRARPVGERFRGVHARLMRLLGLDLRARMRTQQHLVAFLARHLISGWYARSAVATARVMRRRAARTMPDG